MMLLWRSKLFVSRFLGEGNQFDLFYFHFFSKFHTWNDSTENTKDSIENVVENTDA